MCGIMGYVGPRAAAPVLLDGLGRLEYRGYDSAGIAVLNSVIEVRKSEGKVERLKALVESSPPEGSVGIGHTRWATHGAPSDANAHPQTDSTGSFVVVHNGIIENFYSLRDRLLAEGHQFESETDTEILAHLIAIHYDGDLASAVRTALAEVEGAYALVVMTVYEPDKIVAVRRISPLVVGCGQDETFLASDIPAVLHRTRQFIVIEDGEMVTVDRDGATVETMGGIAVDRKPFVVNWDAGRAEKGGYEHFMLKEIHEQPVVTTETLAGRLEETGAVWLDDVTFTDDFARDLKRIWVTGCGTAFNAGMVGKEIFRCMLGMPTTLEYAHEMRYAETLVVPGDLVIAISQSGETADTLASARLAQESGARLLALTNVVGSTLSRQADDVLYTRAGPEISVASTKAYMAILIAEYLLALRLGAARGLVDSNLTNRVVKGLHAVPANLESLLHREAEVAEAAKRLVDVDDVYFIGRGLDYAVAVEGSLKMKEISYVHSEALPAGELKHGTLALITDDVPVIVVLTQQAVYDKTLSAIQEVRARGGEIIAVAYEDDKIIDRFASTVLRVPRSDDLLAPMSAVVPLQLLAYHVANLRGNDIDMPRNLAKSVTVE